MKKLFSLIALVTALTALSTAEGAGLPVEGSWGTTFHDNGISFDLSMKLENQTMTTTNVCTMAGRSLSVSVMVPARYDGASITVLAHAQREVSENGLNCTVSVQPDRMLYQIVGNTLVLSHEGRPEQFVLNRR
jgi:hypothetical protein